MLKTLIKKELLRVFTDRRLLLSVFILPGISMFIIYSLLGIFISNLGDSFDDYQSKVILQNAPDSFIEFIETDPIGKDIQFTSAQESIDLIVLQDQVKSGEADLVMIFDASFIEHINDYMKQPTPNIQLYYLSSDEFSAYTYNTITREMLGDYENHLLTLRFEDLSYVNAFDINQQDDSGDLADEKTLAGRSLGFIFPMLISIFLFASAMSIGTDMIAGEKERGTMATLLLTPVDRNTLALGKVLSLGIISLIGSISLFIGIIASLPFSSSIFMLGDVSYTTLDFGVIQILQLAILLLSMAALFVTITCFLSIFAKTVKEANTYLTPCYMVVVLASILSTTNITTPPIWKFLIPIYGNLLGIQSFLSFTLTASQLIAASSGCVIISIILILLITRKFNDEKIII